MRNPQPDDLTIANVNVDDAIVPFTLDGPTTLGRLRSSTIVVPFDWVEDDPITVGVTSSTGIETVEEIPAAIATPEPSVEGFLGYALIGVLVGILPVALGLLWLPALRQASAAWLVGVHGLHRRAARLSRLRGAVRGVRAAGGAPERARRHRARAPRGRTQLPRDDSARGQAELAVLQRPGFALALLVAIGIGVHNFGEGLAIGASFALGEIQLGTFLIVGFMIHNITEGLGIAAPIAKKRVQLRRARRPRARRGRAYDPRRVARRLHGERRPRRRSSSRLPPARPSRSLSR